MAMRNVIIENNPMILSVSEP